jgi:hypothetical protein
MVRWRFGNDQDRHIDGASIRCTYHFYYFDESAPQQQHTLGKLPRRGWKVVCAALSAMTTEILFAWRRRRWCEFALVVRKLSPSFRRNLHIPLRLTRRCNFGQVHAPVFSSVKKSVRRLKRPTVDGVG